MTEQKDQAALDREAIETMQGYHDSWASMTPYRCEPAGRQEADDQEGADGFPVEKQEG